MNYLNRIYLFVSCTLFFVTTQVTTIKAQSFDTLFLRNVEKKYIIGKVFSIEKDFVVYFRHNLPMGPEFRMNKQNIRWIITSSNEVIEISETYESNVKVVDSTGIAQPNILTEKNPVSVAPAPENNTPEYYTKPNPRSSLGQPANPTQPILQPQRNPYVRPPRNDYFGITASVGISAQRFKNYPGITARPLVSAALELSYIGFRDRLFMMPSCRFMIKNYGLKYQLNDTTASLDFNETQGFIYLDFSAPVGYVLSESRGNRTVFFIGPYYGLLIGGSYTIRYEGTVVGLGPVSGEFEGGIEGGEWDPRINSQTQFYRPYEIGLYTGFRFQINEQLLIGPDVKYGLSNIFPRLINVVGVSTALPQIRTASFQFSLTLLY